LLLSIYRIRAYDDSERSAYFIGSHYKKMIKGNFLGAAIVAILYTAYLLVRPLENRSQEVIALVILNALTIVLMSFAFKGQ